MTHLAQLRCVACHQPHPPDHPTSDCPACGLPCVLECEYHTGQAVEAIRPTLGERGRDLGRFAEFLPVERESLPTPRPPATPFVECPDLAREFGIERLWIKDETVHPGGSIWDRAMAVGLAHARSIGANALACATTGHAGRALARYARESSLPCHLFLPEAASPDRIAAIAAEGARVYRVRGPHEEARAAAAAAAAHHGWADLTPAAHPLLVEGFATCGLEILEEAGDTRPDWVFAPVGEGILVSGLWKGLRHGRSLGFLERMPPKLLGVQAEGASGIAEAFWNMTDLVPGEAGPAPESIRIGNPAGWRRAIEAIRDSAGNMAVVEAGEIDAARDLLKRSLDRPVDDAAAAVMAGVRRAAEEGTILLMDSAVVVLTAAAFPAATGPAPETPLVSTDPVDLEPHLR